MAPLNENKNKKQWPAFMYDKQTTVVGLPYNFGQPKPGVINGPERMRQYGVLQNITDMGYNVIDTGDLTFHAVPDDTPFANIKKPRSVGSANKLIAKRIAEAMSKGGQCVALGGDHSLAIGSIIGQQRVQNNFGVIWVDAHADLNPPLASGSGNAHGMPLSFLISQLEHLIPEGIPEFDWIKPCLDVKDVAYIGLRDLDPAEKEIIKEYDIAAYTMHDILELGIAEVTRRAIAHVSHNNSRPIHLSFDIDGLDPIHAPSTGTPVPGGLSLREGVYITEQIAATGLLSMMDLVEVNPDLGSTTDQEITLQSAAEIIAAPYGRRSRHQLPPDYVMPLPIKQ